MILFFSTVVCSSPFSFTSLRLIHFSVKFAFLCKQADFAWRAAMWWFLDKTLFLKIFNKSGLAFSGLRLELVWFLIS
jgi:hypothetical protein